MASPARKYPPAQGLSLSRVEWPTILVATFIYGGWWFVVANHEILPWVVSVPLLGILVAWQGSLQHETIHNHPFSSKFLSELLGYPPLCLWIPYIEYRDTHLQHHHNELLTDPVNDPESYYLLPEAWDLLSPTWKAITVANRTFLGRIVFIGPYWSICSWLKARALAVIANEPGARFVWATHSLMVCAVLWLVLGVYEMPLWQYLLGAVLLSRSLGMVRSFAEHRWVDGDRSKSAVVTSNYFWSLLFLYNNLHHAHHTQPHVAWYKLPALAEKLHSQDAAREGAGYYSGYFEIARKYLVKPFDQPVHPGLLRQSQSSQRNH